MIIPVETNGTFLNAAKRDREHVGWKQPTIIKLADKKLSPADWIGVSCRGEYGYGAGHPKNNQMMGVFLDKNKKRLQLGPGSQYRPPNISPTNVDNVPFDLTHCFGIESGPRIFLRIPSDATHLALCAPDRYWADNTSHDYAIEITQPNTDPKLIKSFVDYAELTEVEEELCHEEWEISPQTTSESIVDLPRAPVAWVAAPLFGEGPAPMKPQFRGWYNTWAPKASDYGCHPQRGCNPPKEKGKHHGWDIFYPAGTPVVAPAVPCVVTFAGEIKDGKLGKFITFRIRDNDETFYVYYGHLSNILVKANDVITDETQTVGHTGCSGNAGTECGVDLPAKGDRTPDKRRDHLHVHILDDEWMSVNPANHFKFQPI